MPINPTISVTYGEFRFCPSLVVTNYHYEIWYEYLGYPLLRGQTVRINIYMYVLLYFKASHMR